MKLACLKLKCLCDDVMPTYYRSKMSGLPQLHGGLGGGGEEERMLVFPTSEALDPHRTAK